MSVLCIRSTLRPYSSNGQQAGWHVRQLGLVDLACGDVPWTVLASRRSVGWLSALAPGPRREGEGHDRWNTLRLACSGGWRLFAVAPGRCRLGLLGSACDWG